MNKDEKDPNTERIVVLGMHRSGTSVVARLLNMMGAYFGPESVVMKPKLDNPTGFWEREDVVQLNEDMLAALGCTWDCPVPLDWQDLDPSVRSRFVNRIQEIVGELNVHSPWMVKDPRMCLTFPMWRDCLPSCVVVFVYRHPAAIARSLYKRNGIPVIVGLALWEIYMVIALNAIKGLPTIWVSFDEFTEAPDEVAYHLFHALQQNGVVSLQRPAGQKVQEYYKRDLVHHTAESNEVGGQLTRAQRQLMETVNHGLPAESYTYHLDPAAFEVIQLYARPATLERKLEQLAERSQQDVQQLQQQYQKLVSWLTNLDEAMRLHRGSLTYKASRLPLNVLKRMPFVPKTGTAEDEVDRILDEFRSQYEVSEPQTHTSHLRDSIHVTGPSPKSKVALLGRLLVACARNPRETIRLMQLGKIRDAIKVFFVLPLGEANDAVNNVLLGYRRHGRSESLVFPEAVNDASELAFPDSDSPLVSIIVPAYNEYKTNLVCLKAVMDHTAAVPYEVILADDASRDETRLLGGQVKNLHVSRTSDNLGFLENCNHAAKQARGQYIVFLNNDTYVQPGWLDNLIRVVEANKKVGIVGPQLLYPDGRLQEAGGIVWQDGSAWNYGRGDDPEKPEYNYVRSVDYVSGACVLIRRELWQQLGGFDDCFSPAYYEDTDLAFEARRMGYQVVYQPASRVVHSEGLSHGTATDSDTKKFQRLNQNKFVEKWGATLGANHYANGEHVFLAREHAPNHRVVLMIDHYVPKFDRDAGSRSTLMYIKLFLRKGFIVKFLPDNFYKDEPYTTYLQQLGVEILWGNWYAHSWKSWLRSNCAYLDYVYIHRPHVALNYMDFFGGLPNKPKIIYFGHDLHYLRARREYEVTQNPSALREEKMWREKEFGIFSKSDVIYYPSQAEVDEIKRYDATLPVRAIPLYIVDEIEGRGPDFKEREDLLFVGGFNHPPNVDGLMWFIYSVFPHVQKYLSNIKLYIMGSQMPESILNLASEEIVVLGSVTDDELRRQYRRRRLSVVPLRFGAGVKGKILEAMNMQIPVVTTSIGAEGLPVPDEYLSIADRPKAFAQAIAAVYDNEDEWNRRAKRGVAILREQFSDKAATRVLSQDFDFPTGVDKCANAL